MPRNFSGTMRKRNVNTLSQRSSAKKMKTQARTETNLSALIKKSTTNMTRRMSGEIQWLDYIALNSALERGCKSAAKLLLESNCRVNLPSAYSIPSNTPLHHAVLLGDIELVINLLDKEASIAAVNWEGDSPLHLAFVRRRDNLVDVILSYIEKHSNYVNPKNSHGLTHLHIASTRKNAALVENFLHHGANIQDSINADSSYWPGFAALHFAIEFGSPQAIQVLQKALKARKCKSAVKLAYQKVQNLSIMVHMLSAENHFLHFGYFTYPSYFHFACMRDDPKVVEEFIKNGADVNTPISRDATFCGLYSPLHFAVESNCVENVKILLGHGASVEHRNNDNMTALHLAMYHKNCDILDHLYGAMEDKEVYQKDNYGMSYLHIACTKSDIELIKKFLDNHHDVNARIQHNPRKFSFYTPLHFAVRYQHLEVVQLLIERGANINVNDVGESGTPLHLACQVGNAPIVDLLLRNKAVANVTRAKGKKTTLHLLVESYMDKENGASLESKLELLPLVKRFVKMGVNVNAKDRYDYTALHAACGKLVDGSLMMKKLLDVGANVNLENMDGRTPLEMTLFESYCGNADDYMTLYNHVQKLKILGYKVNPKNEGYCEVVLREKDAWDPEHKEFKDKRIERRKEQRREEIQKLRGVRLQNTALSLYDLLIHDAKNLAIFANDQVIMKVVEEKRLRKEYPVFGNFLRMKYEKAQAKGRRWNGQTMMGKERDRQIKRARLR